MITTEQAVLNSYRDTQMLVGGSLSEIVKHGNEIFKYYSGKHDRGYEKLRREVTYLRALPAGVRERYPTIIDVVDTPQIYGYKIPYYAGMVSLSDQLFSERDVEVSWKSLLSILDFMEDSHYRYMITTDGTDSYIDKIIHNRLTEAHDALRAIEPITSLLDGGNKMHDVTIMPLDDIRIALRTDSFTNETLRPKHLHLFHGNFHMDNFLVNDESFMLIDPRGELLGSKLYDVCKLFVHMLIRYDEIHLDRFKLDKQSKEVLLTDVRVGSRYDYMQQRYLKKCIADLGEEYFTKSLLLVGGAHAVSFASYHARKPHPNYDRVNAYLTAGMLLLSAYIQDKTIDLSKPLFAYEAET